MEQFLICLRQAQLTVNLGKSEFDKACVMCLGRVAGKGGIQPIQAKVGAITNFPMPTSMNQLMRLLGWLVLIASLSEFCSYC